MFAVEMKNDDVSMAVHKGFRGTARTLAAKGGAV